MKANGDPFRAAIYLSVFVLGFVASRVSGQTIVPVSQARSISAFSSDSSTSTNPSVSAAGFGVFNTQINLANSSASQNSTIDTATITASGAAHGTFNPPNTGSGNSDFSVTFTLASSCLFTLGGSMQSIYDQTFPTPEVVQLQSTNSTIFQQTGGFSPIFNPSTTFFSTNGVLSSGQYTLSVHAVGSGVHSGTENYNVNFSVIPVPEPASSVLLVLGAATLLGLHRRRTSPLR